MTPANTLNELFHMPRHLQTRWATAENWRGEQGAATRGNDGRKRAPFFPLKAGERRVLAQVDDSSGTVRRIWVTIDNRGSRMLRGLRLEMFWDGAATPAVSAPLGDFFGHGLGRMATFQSALFASPEGRSFNCYIPMPFRKSMQIVVTNETDADLAMFFYEVDYTVGDRHEADTLCFHAHWRRERPTTLRQDYALLPRVTGRGRFLGVTAGVIADPATYGKTWWGEGEVKVFLDGDTMHPTLCGTGTEDYIGTGWGQGQYANLYQGCPLADHERLQYAFYRLHVPDPVYFHQDARVTIQQIGCWAPDTIGYLHAAQRKLVHGETPIDLAQAVAAAGYGLFERQDDWSSCAYFYLDRPENGLPGLAPLTERTIGLLE